MNQLAVAEAAADAHDWQAVLNALADIDPLPADALEIRAMARYALGDFDGCVSSWEQLHARRSATGDVADAARAAVMVAMFLLIDSGLMAPVRGWLARAQRLLDGEPMGPVHALVATVQGYERYFCGDVPGARRANAEALALGQAHAVTPAVAIAGTLRARLMITDGHVDEGLQALDEVGALLMSGDVDPITVGMMLCEIVCVAQSLAMPDLAHEWTEVMHRWGQTGAIGGIGGRCTVHRAELLRLSGPCDAAEAEALAACEALRPWMRREYGWPLVELGNVRLRKGDLEGAEEAYLAADALAWSPQPGLSLLRLAQDDVELARRLIDEAVASPPDLPWKERPPTDDLRLAPFLDAQAEIATAAGDSATCARAAARLTEISRHYPSRGLIAAATLAQSRAALTGGEPSEAHRLAVVASQLWADLGAPYEAAAARSVAGDAAAAGGNDVLAEEDRRAAHRGFSAFGATGRAQHLLAVLGQPSGRIDQAGVGTGAFQRRGSMRRITFGSVDISVADLVGYRHIEELLSRPGEDVAATNLVMRERGDADAGFQLGLPALDDQARDAYRRRLADVDEDIADAESMNDLARAELARRDRQFLIAELSRAVGLDGRTREVGGDGERARTSVFRSIRYAIDRLEEHAPDLAGHLRRGISTGTWCRYLPDPLAPIVWETDSPQRGATSPDSSA